MPLVPKTGQGDQGPFPELPLTGLVAKFPGVKRTCSCPQAFGIFHQQWMNKDFRHETKYLGRMRACVSHNKTPQAVWLIDNRNFFLTVVDAGSPRSEAQHSGVLGALPGLQRLLSCFFTWQKES